MLKLIRDAALEFDITTGPLHDYSKAGPLIQNGAIDGLPPDQWKNEAVGWENFAWAGIQTRLADYGIGPKIRDSAADAYTLAPHSPAAKQLCQSMKRPSPSDLA